MTALIDNKLTLLYKKMVGLSNIVTDTSGDSFFTGSVSVNSNLFVCGTTVLNSDTTINSNLNISGLSLFNGPMSINSSLNISGSTMINGPTRVNSSLTISGTTNINNNLIINGTAIYNGPTTNTSNFYVSGTAIFQNGINVNNINGDFLNMNAPIINIGNANSIVYINGTTTYVASSETLIVDKIISLNVNSTTLQGADNGGLSGIEIMGISSLGFIMTTADASRYQIKTPLLNTPTNYITIQDINNNLVISGSTTLIGASSINSSLNVSGISIFNGSTTMINSLNISGSTIISGYCTINNSITISGTTVINNACSINSSLNISGLTNINNKATVNSSLNVSGTTTINGQMTIQSLLNINGTTNINNATSINSSLYVDGSTIINGPISMNSYLNVLGSCTIKGNETVTSSLFVSSGTIFNSATTINSRLVISGSSVFNNQVSMNSNLGVFGQMVALLPNYLNNTSAKNGGVPLWGWYRTGGIIKIRLNDTPPTIYFTNGSNMIVGQGLNYIDPGAYAIDYFNNYNNVYLTSIASGTSNLLSSDILISGNSTIITQTSTLPVGSYTATYIANDSMDNIGYNYRLLNVAIIIKSFSISQGYILNYVNLSALTASPWCIEFWINLSSACVTSGFNTQIFDLHQPFTGIGNSIWVATSPSLDLWGGVSTNPNVFTTNSWYHVALQYNNNNMNIFVNGINVYLINNYNSSTWDNLNTITIGTRCNNMASPRDYYDFKNSKISAFKISRQLYYTNNFTPNYKSTNTINANTLFLLGSDGSNNPINLVNNASCTTLGVTCNIESSIP